VGIPVLRRAGRLTVDGYALGRRRGHGSGARPRWRLAVDRRRLRLDDRLAVAGVLLVGGRL
jgi:hypothetical protein